MPNSFAATVNLTCSHCNQEFTDDLWLIVDTVERSDLLDRIRTDTLHKLSCSNCKHQWSIDAPLLVYRPNVKPYLLFSPAMRTSNEQDRTQATELLTLFHQADDEIERNSFVGEPITVSRPLLGPMLNKIATTPKEQFQVVSAAFLEMQHLNHPVDMSRRVEICLQALASVKRQDHPQEWSELQNELGNSLVQNPHGSRAENLEQAIHHYEQALLVYTRDAMPKNWAMIQNNLATAYSYRIRDERAENLERAIHHYKQALLVRDQNTSPIDWATTQNNLATIYSERVRGERAENFERAIYHYEQSLLVYTQNTSPVDWAMTQNNLAVAYQNRIRGEHAENLERAIHHYKQALLVRDQNTSPIEWATTQNNLATVYSERIQGERTENLESAIHHSKQSLLVHTRDVFPEKWAMTQNTLANAYRIRIRGNRAENLECAIHYYKQALLEYTHDAFPVDWAMTQNNLATTYLARIRGERAENIEIAIHYYKQTLEIRTSTAAPDDHRHTQRNLGHAYMALARWSDAVMAFQGALTAGDLLYSTAATPEARRAELREARGMPATLAYALVHQAASDPGKLMEAVVTLERNRARWLAEAIALRTGKPINVPDEIWQPFVTLAATIQQLQTESQLPENTPNKRDFLTLTQMLATTRSELQTTIAAVRQYDPDFMPEPGFADIQGVAMTTPLVYFVICDQGALALIVQTNTVTPIWMDVTTEKLNELMRTWFAADNNKQSDFPTWLTTIDQITRQLWDAIMGPLAAALHGLAMPPEAVTLIPTGLLALLPLHAAWTEYKVTGTSQVPVTCKRYFLDDFAVRYTPSALALRHAQERLATVTTQRVLAIDEPRPVHGNALPNSSHEVAAIVDHFAQPTILAHEQATRQTVLHALAAGVDVAHFSCHGGNSWDQPLETALFMAHNTPLTVRDLLELRLPGARLATLSACETGIVGTQLPDEVVMLPSALLQAGFAGVAASLWSVADVSTAMLMARFYDLWHGAGVEPVQALRTAQQWMAGTTNQEKYAYYQAIRDGQPSREASAETARHFCRQISALESQKYDLSHPFWWAAFYFTGV